MQHHHHLKTFSLAQRGQRKGFSWSYCEEQDSRQWNVFKPALLSLRTSCRQLCVIHAPCLAECCRGRREGVHPTGVWRLQLCHRSDTIFSFKIFSDVPNAGIGHCLHSRIYLGIKNKKGHLAITQSQPRKSDSDWTNEECCLSISALLREKKKNKRPNKNSDNSKKHFQLPKYLPPWCITYASTVQEAKLGICPIQDRLQTQIHQQARHLEVCCNTNKPARDTGWKALSAISVISRPYMLSLRG